MTMSDTEQRELEAWSARYWAQPQTLTLTRAQLFKALLAMDAAVKSGIDIDLGDVIKTAERRLRARSRLAAGKEDAA